MAFGLDANSRSILLNRGGCLCLQIVYSLWFCRLHSFVITCGCVASRSGFFEQVSEGKVWKFLAIQGDKEDIYWKTDFAISNLRIAAQMIF